MRKAACIGCGELRTLRGMCMFLTSGGICSRCVGTGYWPKGEHLLVNTDRAAMVERLFPGEEQARMNRLIRRMEREERLMVEYP